VNGRTTLTEINDSMPPDDLTYGPIIDIIENHPEKVFKEPA